jgi:hypothetical protein
LAPVVSRKQRHLHSYVEGWHWWAGALILDSACFTQASILPIFNLWANSARTTDWRLAIDRRSLLVPVACARGASHRHIATRAAVDNGCLKLTLSGEAAATPAAIDRQSLPLPPCLVAIRCVGKPPRVDATTSCRLGRPGVMPVRRSRRLPLSAAWNAKTSFSRWESETGQFGAVNSSVHSGWHSSHALPLAGQGLAFP